jgi:3D (Asp-Asp-Asp) domain-containing protein
VEQHAINRAPAPSLRAGRHCAVDPDIIPMWSKIRILNGKREWVAVDTGTAVKSKKASRGKLPIVDVFAASEAQFKAMRLPKVAMVEISQACKGSIK